MFVHTIRLPAASYTVVNKKRRTDALDESSHEERSPDKQKLAFF